MEGSEGLGIWETPWEEEVGDWCRGHGDGHLRIETASQSAGGDTMSILLYCQVMIARLRHGFLVVT